MKVLVLHSELGVLRGGGETFTRNLFTAFADRGHRVTAAFITDRRGKYPIPLPTCIKPIPIPGRWSRKLGQGMLSSIGGRIPFNSVVRSKWDHFQEAICWRTIRWHNERFQKRIENYFAQNWREYDAVFVYGNVSLASKVANHCPTALWLPGPVGAHLAPLLREVHAVSADGDAFARISAFLGDHVIELSVGLDERIFSPGPSSVRSDLGWTKQQRVVGYVGRLIYLKGVDLLAAAFRELSQTTADARLLIVGNGAEERNIRSVLAKELARGIVHFEPGISQEQLPEWYRAIDVLVMPSRYENFSNVVLEAMACGIPIIASDVGGNRKLRETGGGWLFEPESVSSLLTCLRSAINDRSEMKARGAAGRRYLHGRYSWEASAERLEKIIESRLSSRR